ncbi:N-acetylmuramoyl-L-alanine amidase [Lysinibacillus sp. BPa_S21]|uniref:N-acetylmuramoyl-L-alanine amidase n=1 Tax=Lysinibacillus sp. BPa_S21 TaxID=2932478 RepID=UPI002011615D|nr:N-acetylmuramoyl-L-alanine amidase [Lysinibacillus sp. BPa_S21]MCL1695154.1 N-acetylmuramoyl-L-alanine amidase [Lysinibacillus sp. BPa_S21]
MAKPQKLEFHVGHYGDGTGARSIVDEVQYARKFIKRIYEICIANCVPATYYEDKISKNQTQNINNLIAHHNADNNGFIVSGHLNASGSVTNQGIGAEVLYYDQVTVAHKVVDAICNGSGLKNRGAKKRTDLGVLARTYEPAILIEFGFVTSKKDIELMDKHFEAICQGVAKVLAAHIGYTIKIVEQNKKEETKMANSLTSTAKEDLKTLLKTTYQKGILKVDHSEKVGSMTDGEALGLLISVVKRTL